MAVSEREILLPTQKFLVATRQNGSVLPVIPERRCRRQQQRRSVSISANRIRNSLRSLNSYTPFSEQEVSDISAHSSAALTASLSAVSLKGLNRHAVAPCPSTRERIVSSL